MINTNSGFEMSSIASTTPSEPTPEDIQFLNQVDMGYVGHAPVNKPLLSFEREADPDPWFWKRRKAAQALGIAEELLADEPDDGPESRSEAWA